MIATAKEKKLEAWLSEAVELLHVAGGTISFLCGGQEKLHENDLAQKAFNTLKDFDQRLSEAGLDNGYPEGMTP